MAAEDLAILVGIWKYSDAITFSELNGPSNDIALMRKWLTDPSGGNIPDDQDHIVVIQTPDPFAFTTPAEAPPRQEAFTIVFRELLRKRLALGANRLAGRLYLYFAGHGFCNRSIDRDSEAAIYTANAATDSYDHIFGTYFARVAKGRALFKETVLIMDVCRDSKVTQRPIPAAFNDTPDETLSPQAQLLTIYAVPKGGKAQEAKIEQRENKVHGYLTHALIKALDEARPTGGGEISSTALKAFILNTWETICGPDAPPRPEIFLPASGDIMFAARNNGAEITIKFQNPQAAGTMLTLRNWQLRRVAEFSASGNDDDDLVPNNGPVLEFSRKDTDLVLRLQPGFYEYQLAGGASGIIQVPGAEKNVVL